MDKDNSLDQRAVKSTSTQFATRADLEEAIDHLKLRIGELRELQKCAPSFDDARVPMIEKAVKDTVNDHFGLASEQSGKFRNFAICSGSYMNMPRGYIQQRFEIGFSVAIEMLEREILQLHDLPIATATSEIADTKTSEHACFCLFPIRIADVDSADTRSEDARSTKQRCADLLKLIIKPVLDEFSFAIKLEDQHNLQLDQLLRSELVIADLTGDDAAVLYQLGLRHSTTSPTIHMFQKGSQVLFQSAKHLQPLNLQARESIEYEFPFNQSNEKTIASLRAAVVESMSLKTAV